MTRRSIRHDVGRRTMRAVLVLAMSTAWFAGTAQAQTQLSADPQMYARVRQLPNGELLATMTASAGGNHVDVYASSNSGASFAKVGQITDADFASGLCCGNIFVLPQAVGSLASGTLIWAGSVAQNASNRRMKIKLYKSTNNGRNWTFLTTAVTSANTGGLWEPDFYMANDGALVMMYSDESNSAYSQKLVKIRSYNGTNWVDTSNVVASTIFADRPGMAVVSKLANGNRFMTYELCGPAKCTTFYKTSADGWNWGDATQMGTAIRLADGRYLAHAPTNSILPNGGILVVGQLVMNADNSVAAANGTIIFKSASGSPAGPWTTIPAPVGVPAAFDHWCPNYSSPIRPLSNTQILEFASRWDGAACHMFYNRGPAN